MPKQGAQGSHGGSQGRLKFPHDSPVEILGFTGRQGETFCFCSGAERNPQMSPAKRRCPERIAFDNVRLDGDGRTLQLIK